VAHHRSSSASARSGGVKGKGGKRRRPLSEYDRSKRLPDEEDCRDAFEWLLNDAVKCVAKLIQLDEDQLLMESLQETVREIWTRYKHKWREATNVYSKKYPECRFAFRDFFLTNARKSHVIRHLSISVGKRVEEEMIHEMQMKYHDMDDDDFFRANMSPPETSARGGTDSGGGGVFGKPNSVSASEKHSCTSSRSPTNPPKKKKMRRAILSVGDLTNHAFPPAWKKIVRYPNGIYQQHPYQAIVKIYPSLDLILSILQLALTHFKLGIAPYHLTNFVANGLLPHALNGFALMTPHMQGRVEMVKGFFVRSFVPPAVVIQDLADLLATAIDWYGSDEVLDGLRLKIDPEECLYNVQLLAERMVQDLGFDKQVLTNALALMGDSSSKNEVGSHFPARLNYAYKLYTPLHVAALIVVACKFCHDWETWNIIDICSRSKNESNAIVPWNESQFQSLKQGHQIDHYLGFLEKTAFSALDAPSQHVSDFFQSLEEDTPITSLSTHKKVSFAKEKTLIRPQSCARETDPVAKGEIPTTSELLDAVDEIFRETDKDKTSMKSLICSVAGRFGLNTVSKEVRNQIRERVAFLLKNQYDYITTDRRKRYKQRRFRSERENLSLVTREASHPQYCQLLEYICFVIEEPDAYKLHELVAEIEDELFPTKKTKWVCKFEGCTSYARSRGGGYCVRHGEKKQIA